MLQILNQDMKMLKPIKGWDFNNYELTTTNRVFHKLDEIGNNANIGTTGFTTWKQKHPVAKMLRPVGTELGLSWTSDSKSNTFFSELSGICYLGDL